MAAVEFRDDRVGVGWAVWSVEVTALGADVRVEGRHFGCRGASRRLEAARAWGDGVGIGRAAA